MIRTILKVCCVSTLCLLLVQCKKETEEVQPQDNIEQVAQPGEEDEKIEEVVDENSIEGKFLKDPTSVERKNLYEDVPYILELTAKSLKVKPEKLLKESKQEDKLFYSKDFDSYDFVYNIVKSSEMGYYLSDEFKAEVIKNDGKGVGMMLDVSPQVSNDASKAFGNYYGITIYEDYPDRIAGAKHLFFDIKTKKLYYDPIYEEIQELKYDENLLEQGKQFLK